MSLINLSPDWLQNGFGPYRMLVIGDAEPTKMVVGSLNWSTQRRQMPTDGHPWMFNHPDGVTRLHDAYGNEIVGSAQPAQQEAEPVAWLADEDKNDPSATTYDADVAERWLKKGWKVTPLYTHPTPAPAVPVEVGHRSLLANAQALLDIDATGALVPHGIGSLARAVIADLIAALRTQPAPQVKALEDGEFDALAYRFWSVHPRELDEWAKTAPPMPEGYRGGIRAWFFATQMRRFCLAEPKG